jgi:hypothetical protein
MDDALIEYYYYFLIEFILKLRFFQNNLRALIILKSSRETNLDSASHGLARFVLEFNWIVVCFKCLKK